MKLYLGLRLTLYHTFKLFHYFKNPLIFVEEIKWDLQKWKLKNSKLFNSNREVKKHFFLSPLWLWLAGLWPQRKIWLCLKIYKIGESVLLRFFYWSSNEGVIEPLILSVLIHTFSLSLEVFSFACFSWIAICEYGKWTLLPSRSAQHWLIVDQFFLYIYMIFALGWFVTILSSLFLYLEKF